MSLCCRIVVFLFFILFFGNLYGGDLLIEKDGNYVSSDRVLVEKNKAYRISGVFALENAPENLESYLQIGFVPYGENGEIICELKDFPPPFEREDAGFMLLDTFVFEKNSVCEFSRIIKLSGADLREVSFVAGASLAKGARFRVSQIKIEPLGGLDSGSSAQGGLQGVSFSNGASSSDKNSSEGVGLNASVPFSRQIDANESETRLQALSGAHRIIYVNSDIGSDKFEGFKRKRGHADGPKKTIKSALEKADGGATIVLQESSSDFKVNILKPKANKTLVIKAEGSVVIKSD